MKDEKDYKTKVKRTLDELEAKEDPAELYNEFISRAKMIKARYEEAETYKALCA